MRILPRESGLVAGLHKPTHTADQQGSKLAGPYRQRKLWDDGVANIDLRPGQPIRYPVIEGDEVDLDLGDKEYSWHADIETPEDEHSEFPDRPAALEATIPGSPGQ